MKNILLLFLFFSGTINSQNNIPNNYFDNPIDIPLILSGNFGELRSDHFHSGLDIKTQQREGIPVYAPADGYVKRIKISHYGYGKALYILHPNGYTTVYAHLQKYSGAIQEYVKKTQYEKETFTLELFPDENQLLVKKGELIAFTGNSGSSGGPHLHFEIRDVSSRPMNPMLFGINISDTKKPIVNSVFVYPISEDSQINKSQNLVKLRLILQKNGSYKTENIFAYGKIGFGVSTDDQQNGASNKNGVYNIKTIYNGEEKFNVLFEKFSFAETRYLNRYIDYKYFKTNRIRVQKLFRQNNNPLSIINGNSSDGYITIEEGFTSVFTIEITDYKKNKTLISIPIKGKKQDIINPFVDKKNGDYIYADQATSITKGKFSVYIPANSLYENTYLNIEVKGDTLKVHEDIIPVHKNITITVDVSNYNESDLDKLYLGRINYKGEPYYNTTYRKGTKLSTKTRTLGSYVLVIDTTAPTIKPVNFSDKKWLNKNNTLKVKIEDDLSGISSYRATINGNFILMEYNYKKDVLTYDFDDNIILDSENNLKVIVVDNVGNNATFEATFFRKQS
ncbi:MAG: M23 family metallopeptidase [Bacteroidetes bacterium]|nr:M23 family metallopeptidase [Bacteroidota bacterium]